MNSKVKEEMIVLTKELISIPSVVDIDNIGKIVKFVEEWLKKEGIESEVVYYYGVPNLVAKIGKKDKKKLLWSGHLDVIATGNGMNWDYPPFSAVEKDGYIYGRGSSDAKSGVAAMMMAMKLLKSRESELEGEITLMLAGETENGSNHGTIQLLEQYDHDFNAAIVTEATDLCIEIAEKGLRWIEVRIHGAASHAGRPHLGINAITQAGKIISALEEYEFEGYNDLFEKELRKPSISVNKIHGGIQNNIIAEDCRMVLDRRMLPGETEDKVMKEIKEIVNAVIDKNCFVEYKIINSGWDPYVLDKKAPIIQTMKDAYKNIMGSEVTLRGKATGTDAAYIYKHGIPVIIMGPGDPNVTHKSNERVKISNIECMVDILIAGSLDFLK